MRWQAKNKGGEKRTTATGDKAKARHNTRARDTHKKNNTHKKKEEFSKGNSNGNTNGNGTCNENSTHPPVPSRSHLCQTVGQEAPDHRADRASDEWDPGHKPLQLGGGHADVVPGGPRESTATAVDTPRELLVANLFIFRCQRKARGHDRDQDRRRYGFAGVGQG